MLFTLGGNHITQNKKVKVFLVKNKDRNSGINDLMDHFNINEFSDHNVALKANFNSPDPFPASTHIDTLRAIIQKLNETGIAGLTLAERSGMGNTRSVLEEMGVLKLSDELGFDVVVLDEADRNEWVKIEKEGTHWVKGFYLPKLFLESDKVIQTCCLKTHRFGGHFTLSLKNSVGIVAKKVPSGLYNYMAELHVSPYQRLMVAEINKYYNVDLVVMDAIKGFITRGPEQGEVVKPDLILASDDRVAIDAVGVAILRNYGVKTNISKGRIFELDQIRRASELGIGIKSPSEIELIPLNDESHGDAESIMQILETQG